MREHVETEGTNIALAAGDRRALIGARRTQGHEGVSLALARETAKHEGYNRYSDAAVERAIREAAAEEAACSHSTACAHWSTSSEDA